MKMGQHVLQKVAVVAVLAILVAAPGFSGGFGIFEHGAKAMGTAGAFTARADDPSAMFHNVGGLAFQNDRAFMAGFTWISSSDGTLTGEGPYPPAGYTADLKTLSEFPPHFYWVEPVSDTVTFGLGINSPFGLVTEWQNPDEFLGRFINTKAALTVVDLVPNVAWKASDNLGVGFGVIVRMSEVELHNRQTLDVGFGPFEFAKVDLAADMERGLGFQFGLLHKYNNSFSWGLSYRSKVKVDYEGDARFTQVPSGNPFLDGAIAQMFPVFDVDLPVKTAIEFPDTASLGFAMALGPTSLMEIDVNWTGWSSFDRLDAQIFPPDLGLALNVPENFEDVYNYRLGFVFGHGTGTEWRVGYVYDETPQPDASVSPLLPDSDRNGYTVGYGRQGQKYNFDIAVMYLDFDGRTPSTSNHDFLATYSQTGWLLGTSIGW